MVIVELLENSALLIKLLMRVLFEGGLQRTRGRWKGNEKLVRKFPQYLFYLRQSVVGLYVLLRKRGQRLWILCAQLLPTDRKYCAVLIYK